MTKEKDITTETSILNAAKIIFQQKGMDGARMQEIANEAGINKALLHYYYRSKQLLFEAVFKSAFTLLAPQINKIFNNDDSLFDKIKNFSNNYIAFIIEHPYLPNFIIQELNKNPEFAQRFFSEKELRELIQLLSNELLKNNSLLEENLCIFKIDFFDITKINENFKVLNSEDNNKHNNRKRIFDKECNCRYSWCGERE